MVGSVMIGWAARLAVHSWRRQIWQTARGGEIEDSLLSPLSQARGLTELTVVYYHSITYLARRSRGASRARPRTKDNSPGQQLADQEKFILWTRPFGTRVLCFTCTVHARGGCRIRNPTWPFSVKPRARKHNGGRTNRPRLRCMPQAKEKGTKQPPGRRHRLLIGLAVPRGTTKDSDVMNSANLEPV